MANMLSFAVDCPECGGMGFIDGTGAICAGCCGTGLAADLPPKRTLTPQAPAQKALEALRAEVERLKASLDALVGLTGDSAQQLRRERDAARAEVSRLTAERDAAREDARRLKDAGAPMANTCSTSPSARRCPSASVPCSRTCKFGGTQP